MIEPLRPMRRGLYQERRKGRALRAWIGELALTAFFLLLVAQWALRAGAGSDGLVEIGDDEVAVVVDFWSGTQQPVLAPGFELIVPQFQEVYRLDKSPIEYVMNGAQHVDDNHVPRLVVRSRDSSTFWFETVSILYGIDIGRVEQLLQDSGPDDGFKHGLVDAYARAALLDQFGAFTAAEAVSPDNAQAATRGAKDRLNEQLASHGIEVYEVAASKPNFDRKYEQLVERRRLARAEIDSLQRGVELLAAGKQDALVVIDKKLSNELEKARAGWQLELQELESKANRLRAGQAEELAQLERHQEVTLEKARAQWRQELDDKRRATLSLVAGARRELDALRRRDALELENQEADWTRERDELGRESLLASERHATSMVELQREKQLENEKLESAAQQRAAMARAAALASAREVEQYYAGRLFAGETCKAQKLAESTMLSDRHRRENTAFVAKAQAFATSGRDSVRAALVTKLRSISFEIAPFASEALARERIRRTAGVHTPEKL